ncbi:ATP-grasp domain-containing protein [Blastococcus atacamensis]|uniref:ATP-grasp domain-containing protein n=1 Tax=Blastococcus atacamensis TaxID=2070508 RepID=UPI000CEC274C|nr:ATP-grasp domain-containing protein [Blastococcus atacamensis]
MWAEAPAPVAAPAPAPAPSAVLVTGSGGPAGIAVVRRLVALGHRVVAADADPAAVGGALAQVSVTLPHADHPRFLDALLGAAAGYGVDALIGTVAEELPVLGAGVDRLTAAAVATWLPDPTAVAMCCDEGAFAERMQQAGVCVAGPDLVARTREGVREFTADALVDRNGRLLTVVPRWPDGTRAGIPVQGTTFESATVTDLVSDALAAVGLTGPATVRGCVADDGTATVVRIDPRFSGGLPLTLAAGADVVAAYLTGIRHPQAQLPFLYFTAGVRMRRFLAETYTAADGSPVVDPYAPAAVSVEVPA